MRVFAAHSHALTQALRAPSPIVVLPPLHPEYIRALLVCWGRESGGKIKLLEPGVGRSSLSLTSEPLPGGQLGRLRRAESTTALLLDQIDAAVHAPDQADAVPCLLWLTNPTELLAEGAATSHLAALCRRIVAHRTSLRLILSTASTSVLEALRPWLRELELSAPRDEAFHTFIDKIIEDHVGRYHTADEAQIGELLRSRPNEDTDPPINAIARSLQGLDAGAINQVIEAAIAGTASLKGEKHHFRDDLLLRVEQERRRQFSQASGLAVIDNTFSDGDLQGMNRYQRYLDYVRVLFNDVDASRGNSPRARGVLLVGLPGCGKSLAARMTAHKLNVPLLKLDVGEMMGRFLGESEGNLSRALDAAEAAAPCVLWVDEIEKALGGMGQSGEGAGTGSRILGKLLGWMQDHTAQVYLFATANGVDRLPPEILRRGRFDELWRVMLPTASERRAILTQKLRSLKDGSLSKALETALDSTSTDSTGDFAKLWQQHTEEYTGADLTSVVFEAWMHHVVHKKPITAGHLIEVIDGGFQPMAVQFQDKIKTMSDALTRHGFRDVTEETASRLPPPIQADRLRHTEMLAAQLRPLWTAEHMADLLFEDTLDGKRYCLRLSPAGEDSEPRPFWIGPHDVTTPFSTNRDCHEGTATRAGKNIQLTSSPLAPWSQRDALLTVDTNQIVIQSGERLFVFQGMSVLKPTATAPIGESPLILELSRWLRSNFNRPALDRLLTRLSPTINSNANLVVTKEDVIRRIIEVSEEDHKSSNSTTPRDVYVNARVRGFAKKLESFPHRPTIDRGYRPPVCVKCGRRAPSSGSAYCSRCYLSP